MKIRNSVIAGLVVAFACIASMTLSYADSHKQGEMEKVAVMKAIAVLYPAEGYTAQGVVTFMKEADSIRIMVDVEGLAPGKHGFHIHEYGDCSAPDATSAGGHFNPEGTPHGAPDADERHVGDLGNIAADSGGDAELEMMDQMIAFSGDHSIIGLAVVIHAGEDDLTSQPSGNAGPRVACGVIGIAQAEMMSE